MHGIYWPSQAAWTWVSLEGPDAQDFLHRMSSVDTRNLPEGSGTMGFFLEATGRPRAAFWLWKYGPESFGFELPREASLGAQALRATIEQFTFAERQVLAEMGEALRCAWVFSEASENHPLTTTASSEEIRVCDHGTETFGARWQSVWGRPARLQQFIDREFSKTLSLENPLTEFDLLEARIRALSPWWESELCANWNPLEVGAAAGAAEQKGCYPGQEVLEKIWAIGEPARRLVLLESSEIEGAGPAALPIELWPAESSADAPSVGTLTSTARKAGLAVVRKLLAREGTTLRTETGALWTVRRVAPFRVSR